MKKISTKLLLLCSGMALSLIFNTAAHAQYCASAATSLTDEWITNVSFAGIDNPSFSALYSDYTAQTGTISAGQMLPISVTVTAVGAFNEYVRAWVDWNQDEVFDQETEQYDLGMHTFMAGVPHDYESIIAAPANAVLGTTRMRVTLMYSGYAGPCDNFAWGEVEDYSINVLEATCTPLQASSSVVVNCETNTFTVDLVVDSIGSNLANYDIEVTVDDVAETFPDVLENLIGATYSMGPYDVGTNVSFSVIAEDESCNLYFLTENAIGLCPPVNDLPCDAITLACDGTYSGSFIGATAAVEDDCFGTGTGDVWFHFVSDGSQAMIISETSGSDVIVELYMGTDCDTLTPVVTCSDFPEELVAGEAGDYYFRIRPYSTAADYAVSLICVDFAENDEACTATSLVCGDSVTGTFLGSTESIADECFGSATGDVWFSFVSDGSETMTINEIGADAVVQAYVGDECGNLTPLTECNDFDETFSAEAAGTYYFRVRPYGDITAEYEITLTCTPFECPALSANIGSSCDDANPDTYFDVVSADCVCAGETFEDGDICETAITVGTLPYTATDNTANYGDEYDGAPGSNCGIANDYLGGDDVFYSYTADYDQVINISMTPTGLYSGLFVYGSCATVGTECLAGVASFDEDERYIENFSMLEGETIYIVISTWASPQSVEYVLVITESFPCPPGSDTQGMYIGNICDDGDPTTMFDEVNEICECAGIPIPANDEACGAISLSCGDVLTDQSLIAASQSIDDACFGTGTADLWYTFVSDGSQVMTVSGFDADLIIEVYEGECGDLTSIFGCSDYPEAYSTIEPGTYYLRVRGWSEELTTFSVSLTCALPAENDEPCNAIELPVNSDCVNVLASNIGASGTDMTDPSCAFYQGGDVWFFAVVPESGILNIEPSGAGAGGDAGMAIYSGSCNEGLTELECDDDGGEGAFPAIMASGLTAGDTILVRFWEYGNDAQLEFNICASMEDCPNLGLNFGDACDDGDPNTDFDVVNQDCICIGIPPAENDEPCDALPVTCGETVSGSTANATLDAVGTCTTLVNTAPGVWYEIAGLNGTTTVSLCTGTSFDSKIAVFSGTCDDYTCIAGNDDSCGVQSEISFASVTGETYYVLVTGYATNNGPFELTVSCELIYDCLELEANVGDVCDDGNEGTIEDIITEDCECSGTVGIAELSKEEMVMGLYGETIRVLKPELVETITIYSVTGQKVQTESTSKGEIRIDNSNARGIYIAIAYDEDGNALQFLKMFH